MSGINDMDVQLQNRRMQAAIASKGIGADVIYQLVIEILKRSQLRGDLLDYGAGIGSLIKHLLDSDYPVKITGADILAKPSFLSKEINWVHEDLNNPLGLPD